MYAFRNDIKEKKVCKGIKKSNIEKMKFEMYKNCLVKSEQTREKVYSIVSKQHNLYTCLLYTSPSPRDRTRSRMPSSA